MANRPPIAPREQQGSYFHEPLSSERQIYGYMNFREEGGLYIAKDSSLVRRRNELASQWTERVAVVIRPNHDRFIVPIHFDT